ncbi:MAG: GTP pyrophosphokinase family protein, partial [Oscillospiraceae bacterium]|nr:GTP pyrophosphokinase family protein [Oscillospiraceae bacterium]
MKPENINHPVLKYIIEEDIAKDDYYALVSEYQQMILLYESAVKQLITKFEIFNQEYKMRGARNPIETVKSRVKGPESIVRKMKKYGFEKSLESIVLNLNDVAGVRVICSYVSDIYLVRDMLLAQKDVTLVEE